MEATANTRSAYNCLAAHTGRVVVNPYQDPPIAEAPIYTDKLCAKALVRLLPSNFICEV